MRRARKKKIEIQAYRLGEKSEMIDSLIKKGEIRVREDGSFEVFSRETNGDSGEIAQRGDYIKLDSAGRVYPNEAAFFEKNHVHIKGDFYEQRSPDVLIWMYGDPIGEEIRYLIEQKKLTINEENPRQYFQAFLWGTQLSAAKDAVIVFYQITRNEDGEITDVDFNFVARDEFEKTYELSC